MSNATFHHTGRVSRVYAKDVAEKGFFNIDLAVEKSWPDPEKEGEFKKVPEFYFMKVLGKKVPATFNKGNLVICRGNTWLQDEKYADIETGEVRTVKVTGYNVRDYQFMAAPRTRDEDQEEQG